MEMEMEMEMLLKGRVALVTGAGRGLGQAVTVAYARHGAQVVAAARTASELDHTAGLVREVGGRMRVARVDLVDERDVRSLIDLILADYGRVDVLVNNAGQLLLKPFVELTLAEWDNLLAVNLRASVLTCKLLLAPMASQGGGSIINVSSNAGVLPFAARLPIAPRSSPWRASAAPLRWNSRRSISQSTLSRRASCRGARSSSRLPSPRPLSMP